MDVSGWLRKQLEEASPDLLRAMVQDVRGAVDGRGRGRACGAGYGERTPERVNHRNGYRERDWDTRVGHDRARDPEAPSGQLLPGLAAASRAGGRSRRWWRWSPSAYVRACRTRRVEKLVQDARHRADLEVPGVAARRSRSTRSSRTFRTRPLDGGPYTYVWLDALTQKVREGGRIVNVAW